MKPPPACEASTRPIYPAAAGIGGRDDFDGLTFHDLRHEASSRDFEGGRLNIAEKKRGIARGEVTHLLPAPSP